MSQNIVDGDLTVRGALRVQTFPIPANAVGNTQVSSADPIVAEKVEHQFVVTTSQVHGTAAATERRAIHSAHAAGEVLDIQAGVVVACIGAATITIDLKKNGTTMLTGVITLDNGNVAYAEEAGTLVATPTYVAGDVLELVITATAGGGTLGQGLYVRTVLREAAD